MRSYVVLLLLTFAWAAVVVRVWPGMDGFSNFVSALVALPLIVPLAWLLRRV